MALLQQQAHGFRREVLPTDFSDTCVCEDFNSFAHSSHLLSGDNDALKIWSIG
ncbi:MAG: hypothetical protein GFH27_549291n328 [Chloroflexi bacterium AL-W]|nr:hypothetical protein [Chloroflexi bacterium AL-N1]NOK67204.1 hypothetical protein [Chloroflexi bacterium AL-N10]NOK75302.1 hypothetical protein [Chloroflexi bacterium AL-N5]NOK82090.1 hypothetical protein [Chloroflexi bacterium AL-W]NOK89935.1 hypothetical protein [Chloroflexi bacterium AL-N15]